MEVFHSIILADDCTAVLTKSCALYNSYCSV